MTAIQYAIEISLSILLALGIFYSIHLGRALAVLRRDRQELVDLVARLDASGHRAEGGVEKLKRASDVSGRALSRMIDQSKLLQAELEALAEKGDAIAGRLDGLIRQGERSEAHPTPDGTRQLPAAGKAPVDESSISAEPRMAPPRPYEQRSRVRTAAEQDLLRVLRMG
ncbi:hypothetical protein J2D73_02690 [Acetobacter sacchari]|uniref:DUF6468 domain-containing protein n=1 Tax=Acetobacter sacchari TaxID=2661687 RepID=A0ABS3LS25_9PROT|nr:DUF6468 domain-containing protein [Acetobacter sacchari]MBO1358705.1 hypothetical protein [Acetobacter sacchari]